MMTVGSYVLGSHLGDCGVSQACLARPVAHPDSPPVVIKRVVPAAAGNQMVQEMARQEARLLMAHHPGVVKVDALLEENGPWTVMQHHPGVDVRAAVKASGTLSPSLALHAAAATARALHQLHHTVTSQSEPYDLTGRTLGPGDVWLCLDGQVRLMDFFGAVPERVVVGRLPGAIMGARLEWLSPEQVRGTPQVDSRTDVWALGALLFLMLTGVTPFKGASDLVTLELVRNGRRPPLTSALAAFERLFHHLFQLDREDRPGLLDAAAMMDDLSRDLHWDASAKDVAALALRGGARPVEVTGFGTSAAQEAFEDAVLGGHPSATRR